MRLATHQMKYKTKSIYANMKTSAQSPLSNETEKPKKDPTKTNLKKSRIKFKITCQAT